MIPRLVLSCAMIVLTNQHREDYELSRQERSLVFGYSAVTQLTFGITAVFPLDDMRSTSTNLCFQIQYLLPDNITEVYDPIVIRARSRSKRNIPDFSRRQVYSYLENLLEDYGFEGRQCLLRSICEVAQIPLHTGHPDSLTEELVHIVMTPSLDMEEINMDALCRANDDSPFRNDDYMLAEYNGRMFANCQELYSDCVQSPIEIFTEYISVYDNTTIT